MARNPGASSVPTRALRAFLATEVAGGMVLVAATAVALVWANSPWRASYEALWHAELTIGVAGHELVMDLRHWTGEGLMAVFFFVVALEIKRELVEGELADRRMVALPVMAALGGMVAPALVYLAVVGGGEARRGWGIPIATDIAFALAVAGLAGRAVPASLRLFLLTLAIVDDIGAIVVIAFYYSDELAPGWLAGAAVVLAVAFALRHTGLLSTPLLVGVGAGLWLCLHAAGVHATMAGVVVGLLAPARPALSREIVLGRTDELLDVFSPEAARTTARLARLSVSPTEWLEHLLHPWTSLVIVPAFVLANAGVRLRADMLADAASSRLTWAVVAGLVVGKFAGVSLGAWLACRLGLATLPEDVRWNQLLAVAVLAGIGFTVSLFVNGLAFTDAALADQAKVGIVASAVLTAAVGYGLLRWSGGRPRRLPTAEG